MAGPQPGVAFIFYAVGPRLPVGGLWRQAVVHSMAWLLRGVVHCGCVPCAIHEDHVDIGAYELSAWNGRTSGPVRLDCDSASYANSAVCVTEMLAIPSSPDIVQELVTCLQSSLTPNAMTPGVAVKSGVRYPGLWGMAVDSVLAPFRAAETLEQFVEHCKTCVQCAQLCVHVLWRHTHFLSGEAIFHVRRLARARSAITPAQVLELLKKHAPAQRVQWVSVGGQAATKPEALCLVHPARHATVPVAEDRA